MQRTIAFVIFDGFQILDFSGPLTVFEVSMVLNAPPPYRVRFVAPRAGLIRSSSGAMVQAERFDAVRNIDTVIVSGGDGVRDPRRHLDVVAYLARVSNRVRRVCSVCTGAFLLARAELLSGRRVTTHWHSSAEFAQAFPSVALDADRIYVRDDKYWTSGGVTAGIDVALAMLAEDRGAAESKAVARMMVVYHQRSGGQSQFAVLAEFASRSDRFRDLLNWVRQNIARHLTVDGLAMRCGMSPRTFARLFRQEVGITPAKCIERIRLDCATALIEEGSMPVAEVALKAGFHDAERMRRAFIRFRGQPPQALRRSARRSR